MCKTKIKNREIVQKDIEQTIMGSYENQRIMGEIDKKIKKKGLKI